jgi:hypothetical protein
MSWPFVSRSAYNAQRETLLWERVEHERVMASVRADLATERDRYDALLEKFTALRVAGAIEIPKVQPVPVIDGGYEKRDELKELIGEVCGSDYAKRKVMLRQVAVDRAAKMEDDVIRAAILAGVQTDGVPI